MLIADDGPGVRYCWRDAMYLHGSAGEGGAWMRLRADLVHIPDLTDPATLGCLLALVREAHGDPLAVCVARSAGEWEVRLVPPSRWHLVASGDTEAAALVAALEAACQE